ncbi:hypothetical protein KHA90_03995 [Flavobacterium psychroterrae]|jgi:hypothetical protein|uniref:Bacteriocin n=1 Tax=Flavobacterium psychroterrae TaxID=2133767 RepID=A0ABS5P7A5_9FLAO|nr:hypothetical protein [Flavobacterium psychroterrae]MBS7230177.1 hypothetical protein [Flavobacterium psychroterrae]
MKNTKLKLDDFRIEKLDISKQKIVLGGGGGDPPLTPDEVDPGKGIGSGNQ